MMNYAEPKAVSAILLAGGIGARMKLPIPKQYYLLNGKPIARYSFEMLISMKEIVEVIVVCVPEYRHFFAVGLEELAAKVKFAMPGKRRQDSVYSGFQEVSQQSELVCIHDAARPFITQPLIRRVIEAASQHGAA